MRSLRPILLLLLASAFAGAFAWHATDDQIAERAAGAAESVAASPAADPDADPDAERLRGGEDVFTPPLARRRHRAPSHLQLFALRAAVPVLRVYRVSTPVTIDSIPSHAASPSSLLGARGPPAALAA